MSEHPDSLAESLVAFQAALPRVTRNTEALYGKYANLADVSGILLPRLAQVGLCYTTHMHSDDQGYYLRCELRHVCGEAIASDWPIPAAGPQVMGGTVTYARRYSLLALTGVHPEGEDDDAQEAQAAHKKLAADTVKTPRKATRPRTAKGEDEWTVGPTHATDAQRKMMWAMLRALDFDRTADSADSARRLLSAIAGRELQSSTELTSTEASTVIEALKGLQDSPDSSEAIRVLIDGQMM